MDYGHLIEEKVKQAIEKGEFDHLPGKGRPLPKDKFAHLPPELRNSYRILKNAHMLPEEMILKKEIIELEELLEQIKDPQLSSHYKKEWKEKKLRFDMMMEKRKVHQSSAFKRYQKKINHRFGF
ncbi:protein of unknown function [Halobacillus karajensis]|uniref:DnaJ homologue subfamily C member 28 conserved domain-containing protein n=1 Tax=Halobacillus karajensis TaxID=195088 RepID=A0A024P6T9_9BACI|nr:DUF1992 domain-containing protein [Halobacillus karajensis]CDQ20474.1 hypothetical protein BN982_02815 [Halobacillus karajensis]CDQ24057.1 hypothetical protein BN983_02322 [Halobacillus karajensis]CDQ27535.1 hypothetical protein BN981_01803 [Halobacillus karajensis]SEH91174.1 protein of unknown function [Halobacillus karajensis]